MFSGRKKAWYLKYPDIPLSLYSTELNMHCLCVKEQFISSRLEKNSMNIHMSGTITERDHFNLKLYIDTWPNTVYDVTTV